MIGIIGLGRMGSAMAERLAAQGVPVAGWTRSGRAVDGIDRADDLAALVAQSDVLITSLYDNDAVAEVLDALLALDLSGKLIIETSTAVPTLLTERADAIAAAGAAVVDAPISGGPELVLAGQCGIFVGGAEEPAARALSVLRGLTDRVFHVGPLGTGMVMKTINNSMLQAYVVGLTDMLRLAKRADLPMETMLRILCGGPAGIPMITDRLPKILGQDRAVGFTLEGVLKDNAVFNEVLAAYGVGSDVLRMAGERQAAGVAAGLGARDPAELIAMAYHNG